MRIASLEAVPIALPFREDYVTGRGRLNRRDLAITYLHTDDGPTGLGETVALSLRGGLSLGAIVSELEHVCGPALVGAELDELATATPSQARANIAALLAACGAVSLQARAAVDLALHDLAGKLSDTPVWRLLGAQRAGPVGCNGTLVAGPPASVARRAARLVDAGFETLKMKAATATDIEAVRAVRAIVGPSIRLRVDANGLWSVAEALENLRQLESVALELAEQPSETLDELVAVRSAAGVPIVADESVATPQDAGEAVRLDACDAATLKLAKVGGIAAALQIASVLPCYLSSALDGPIGIAAAGHLAQALPSSGFAADLAHGLATSELFAVEPARSCAQVKAGALELPPGPGFGVALDSDAIDRLRI